MSAPPPKRRAVLVPVSALAPAACDVEIAPTLSLSADVTSALECRRAQTATVHSSEQLGQLLQREANLALQTHDQWARSPGASWIKSLSSELPKSARPALFERQRKLSTLAADDFAARWEARGEFASLVVELWLGDESRSLEDVLAKSAAFGHDSLASGLVLSGKWVKDVAKAQNMRSADLLPMVEKLVCPRGPCSTDWLTSTASVYRVTASNHFVTDAGTSTPIASLRAQVEARIASGAGGFGSLNTTFEFSEDGAAGDGGDGGGGAASGVPLLDRYWESLDDMMYVTGEASARLNPRVSGEVFEPTTPLADTPLADYACELSLLRLLSDACSRLLRLPPTALLLRSLLSARPQLYLIWKLPGYLTPYHQDVHVPPHFTLYNQVHAARNPNQAALHPNQAALHPN